MSPAHKRALSGANALISDGNGASDAKKARQDPDVDTLRRENQDLKTRLDEAYAFIAKKNLVHVAPPGIQTGIMSRPNGAGLEAYAASLHREMRAIHKSMAGKTMGFLFKKTGVTSDHISEEVAALLPDVQRIRDVIDQPRNLEIAYNLVMDLQALSYGGLEASYGERPSDDLSDKLLMEIALERRERGEVWDYAQDLRSMEETSATMNEYGIDTWYPNTIILFKKWKEEDAPAE